MVLIEKFCFWFSVRLGTLIISVTTLVQASIWLMISIISINNEKEISDFLNEIFKNLSINNNYLIQIANDPKIYLISLAIFLICLMVACLVAIIGAFLCMHYLLYPFIVLDFIYLLYILLLHVFFMLTLKEKEYDLGSLILYSNVGAFLLLFLLYKWICVYSLLQIIKDLRKNMDQHQLLAKDRHRHFKAMMDTKYQNNYMS